MANLSNEKITKGKIEFWRRDIICSSSSTSSIVFKGTFKETIDIAVAIDVAIKRIPLELTHLAENEIKMLLEKLDHDNVVRFYCKEQDNDFCYIAMQLCRCNLEEYVVKKDRLGLPNTPVEEILRGAAEGLSHIHKKDIIHRDIKPSNILLFVKEKKLVAKISNFGVSRIVPNHRNVLDNSSAGTDLFKAPEVLTPAFSWRSDVYAFGLVVFYVLSKGQHLFDNKISKSIEGNPGNLPELNKQPDALSLVKWLTAFNQKARPRMYEVVNHPFFWDDEKKLNFIKDVHQITEDKKNAFLKEMIDEDSHHVICSSPENCGKQQTPHGPAACADWTHHLEDVVINDFRGKVDTKSCADLVRTIRHKLTHFYGIKEDAQAAYGGGIKWIRRYWLDRFPSLVVHLWEKVEITHLTALLSGYFALESVRRRNVETTLIRAVDEGKLGQPEELLNKVKRLGSKTCWERVLRSAIGKGTKEHVQVLLENVTGTNIVSKDLLTTLLLTAGQEDRVEVVELLINHGADVKCENVYGRTPLHSAASNGHSAIAEFLIESGAAVNCKDGEGWTPLHHAASKDFSAFAKLLIERGAEVNCENLFRRTPLHSAASNGHLAIAEFLIENGAAVNCKDGEGWTPLHITALNGHLEVAKLLIGHGAEISCTNYRGLTPLDYAVEESHTEMIKLLRNPSAPEPCALGQTSELA